jgi:hypothetical protein
MEEVKNSEVLYSFNKTALLWLKLKLQQYDLGVKYQLEDFRIWYINK